MTSAASMNPFETFQQATGRDADKYRAVLQKAVDRGAREAGMVIERIQRDQPKDQIVRTRAVHFEVPAGQHKGVAVVIGEDAYVPSDYALGQLAAKANVPSRYLKELAEGSEWRQELAAHVLNEHYGHVEEERVLVRSVGGQMRGWLSDKYRRLDSRPLVDALVREAQAVGALPIGGSATETRTALKIIHPEILEPTAGEFVVVGGEWSNSDYGNGVHGFRAFLLRVACLNGATTENVLRQVHLGGKLADNIEFSDRTYRLDTAASVSALQDVVRGVLGPAGRNRIVEQIRKANEQEYSKRQLQTATKDLTKAQQKAVVEAFAGEDVINLPGGETAWRASNAISWVARHTEDPEVRLDLERLAGTLL